MLELTFALGALVLVVLAFGVHVASLQVASNALRPAPRLDLGQALAVCFVGGILSFALQCLLGAALMATPGLGGLLGTVAGAGVYALVLSRIGGADILISVLTVLLWWLLQAVVWFVLAGSMGVAVMLTGLGS